MDLSSLRALVVDLNFAAHGVDLAVTAPDGAPIATRGIWQTPQSDDLPPGLDLRRREALRSIAIPSIAGVFPARSIVLAPLEIGGPSRYWEIDGFERITTAHLTYRVLPLDAAAAVIASGADHFWRLDEPAITDPVLDSITGDRIGSYAAAGVTLGEPGATDDGTAARFTSGAQTDGVYNGATKLLLAARSTIAAWIRPMAGAGTIISWRNEGITVKPWMGLAAGAKLRIETTRPVDNAPAAIESLTPIPLDVWTFVVWTSDGAAGDAALSSLYINGVLDQVATQPKPSSWTGPATIGFDLGSGVGFDGWIDEVAVWSRELDAAEIAGLFAAAGNP